MTVTTDAAGTATNLDPVVERKLHDIDREDIHEVTDGSDDGFLYARGFIVALGRAYYEAVRTRPAGRAERRRRNRPRAGHIGGSSARA
ncbi:hypothetical protein [Micromonospora sp. NPDC005220]|uniref:hypothetical protein n=1 Tax=Micromonospora sp. NPDC005220 TaxID=3155589 RepID=UPI0033A7ED88